MVEKAAEKTAKKLQRSRLTHKEKLEVCRLLGSGLTMNEVAQIMSKNTKKAISIWRIRYYLDSPKWSSLIRAARKDDISHAEKIAVFSTTGRVRKYDRLLEVFEKKFYQSIQDIESEKAEKNLDPESALETFKILHKAASYMIRILKEIRKEEYSALLNKSGNETEAEDFFVMVEQRIIASRRRRDPDRELEKAAGLL